MALWDRKEHNATGTLPDSEKGVRLLRLADLALRGGVVGFREKHPTKEQHEAGRRVFEVVIEEDRAI